MLRRFVLLAFLTVLFATFASAQTPFSDLVTNTDSQLRFGNGIGFEKRISGTWLGSGSFSVDLGCDGTFDIPDIPFTDAHTFGLGGIHVAVNPANPNSNLGTWQQTGHRTIGGRDINFGVDATPGGTLTTIAVISFTVEFDRYLEVVNSTFEASVYLPTQDPLDPDEPKVACTVGQHNSLRKVAAK